MPDSPAVPTRLPTPPMTADPKTQEQFHRYMLELSQRRVEDDPRVKSLRTAKRVTWMLLLACAFLFFYLLDKMVEALSLL